MSTNLKSFVWKSKDELQWMLFYFAYSTFLSIAVYYMISIHLINNHKLFLLNEFLVHHFFFFLNFCV